MMKATQECVSAVTTVIWNIDTCPVPPGFDARRVGPCMKRYLEKLGYTGTLTINATGLLTDVLDEVLRGVSSTGVVINADPFVAQAIHDLEELTITATEATDEPQQHMDKLMLQNWVLQIFLTKKTCI
ncbi:unnamed protein product [Microthlaspi erraticum]|uniref:NYN domain-containing protein n=1 Tax=Microthlaspi erraticum TaxID=1685480 RepID=A0A6D2HEU4_9BRAS|nr:unnamed protein product [Microthlaspi erraticum]